MRFLTHLPVPSTPSAGTIPEARRVGIGFSWAGDAGAGKRRAGSRPMPRPLGFSGRGAVKLLANRITRQDKTRTRRKNRGYSHHLHLRRSIFHQLDRCRNREPNPGWLTRSEAPSPAADALLVSWSPALLLERRASCLSALARLPSSICLVFLCPPPHAQEFEQILESFKTLDFTTLSECRPALVESVYAIVSTVYSSFCFVYTHSRWFSP